MVIAAGVHVFKLTRLMITALGVDALEQEAFDFIRRIQRVSLLLVQRVCKALQDAANVRGISGSSFVDHFAKDQHLARAKNVCWPPIERTPVDAQPQVALSLRGEAANRGSVKSKIVPTLDQKLLVVVQHMQTTFKIAEQYGYGFDPFLVSEILEPFFLDKVGCYPFLPLLFGLQVQLFQLVVGNRQKITQFGRHESP